MLKITRFDTGLEGKHILFLGAIHGDEICGPEAIHRIINEIDNGSISFKKGSVTFVPICNPLAFAKGVRQIRENLNRIIEIHEVEKHEEQRYANQIVPLIKEADVLIDLHSFERQGVPFLFLDHPTETMQNLANTLGGKAILYGWDDIYEDTPQPSHCTEWCAFQNNTEALTFECGQNNDPNSIEKAYEAILRTLAFFDMVDHVQSQETETHHLEMKKIYTKEAEGNFTQNFNNITELKQGDVIAEYENGEIISMPFNGFLILPKPWAKVGDEWFYTAAKID